MDVASAPVASMLRLSMRSDTRYTKVVYVLQVLNSTAARTTLSVVLLYAAQGGKPYSCRVD